MSDVELRTRAYLDAVERKDLSAVAELIDERVTFTMALSLTGKAEDAVTWAGRERILGYQRGAFAQMGRIAFVDRRVSVTADGRTAFVQANGDFTTADGRPYRNVYVFRFDWEDGRMVSVEEYPNPLAFLNTFGPPPGMGEGPDES